MSDITLGQYFPGNSPLHRLDARAKIVLLIAFMVTIFICKNFVNLAIVAVATFSLVAVSKIGFKTVTKSIKPLKLIIVLTFLINVFYGSGDAIEIFGKALQFNIFSLTLKITLSGIFTAVFTSVRIVLLVVSGSLLTYTTSPTSITDAIESLLKPLKYIKIDIHSLAMIMTIALRFIPTLVEEVDKITAAQKSRGADMDSGNLINKIKAIVPIIIPLFISSFKRAEELAYAMECRCYNGGDGRTKMKVMHLSAKDYIAFVIMIAFYAVIIITNIYVSAVI